MSAIIMKAKDAVNGHDHNRAKALALIAIAEALQKPQEQAMNDSPYEAKFNDKKEVLIDLGLHNYHTVLWACYKEPRSLELFMELIDVIYPNQMFGLLHLMRVLGHLPEDFELPQTVVKNYEEELGLEVENGNS